MKVRYQTRCLDNSDIEAVFNMNLEKLQRYVRGCFDWMKNDTMCTALLISNT